MSLDPKRNFVICTVSGTYSSSDTSITLTDASLLPTPSTDGSFNVVWFNSTDYPQIYNDPLKEIIRVTDLSSNTITVVRPATANNYNGEGSDNLASDKNLSGKIYKIALVDTRKNQEDINTSLNSKAPLVSPTFSTSILTDYLTTGSITFIGNDGIITQDNSNLFWDNTNKRLGIGKKNPIQALDINGSIIANNLSGSNTGDETDTTIKTKIGAATSTNSGYLTSTDWSTFNAKQPAGAYITLTSLSSGATGLSYNNTTGAFSLTSGYVIPTTTEQTNWGTAYTNTHTHSNKSTLDNIQEALTTTLKGNYDTAYSNRITSLTTTGSSGAATLLSNTLNIPNYTLSGLGGQPQLNGTGFVKASGTTISYDNSTYLTSIGTGVANELTYWSGTNSIGSLATTTYPSLTELARVKGVTSAIQTQIDGRNPYHGVLARPVGASNPLPTSITTTTFTLGATANPISYYYMGQLVTVSSDKTTTLNDGTAGLYYVYFNGATGNILATKNHPGIDATSNVIIATVAWNGTNLGLVSDERHSYNRNKAWHVWAHNTVGCRYRSGLTLTHNGGTGAAATFALTAGEIADEDIQFAIDARTTARVWYQNSANSYAFVNNLTSIPFYAGANNRPNYVRNDTYAVVQMTSANNRFINVFVYATTDLGCPLSFVVETVSPTVAANNGYNSANAARAIPFPNLIAKGGREEIKPIYRLIIRADGQVQAIDTVNDDYRMVASLPQGGGTASTTASAVSFNAYDGISAGNVQTAIEELADEKANLASPIFTGEVTIKGSTNDGSTHILTGKDSDDAEIYYIDTLGNLSSVTGYFKDELRLDAGCLIGWDKGGAAESAMDSTAAKQIRLTDFSGNPGVVLAYNNITSSDVTASFQDLTGTIALLENQITSFAAADAADYGKYIKANDSTGELEWATVAGGVPTTITVADEASDTTCFPLFVTAATGDLGPKTNAHISFDSSTGVLTDNVAIITPKLYPASDGTTAMQFMKADGTTPMMIFDTTGGVVGIGRAEGEFGGGGKVPLSIFGTTGETYLKIHDNRSNTGDIAGIKFTTQNSSGAAATKTIIAHIETGPYGTGDFVIACDGSGDMNPCTIANDEKFRIQSTGEVFIGTIDRDGTPAIGRLVVKGSTNDGSTNIFVGRDSDEVNVFTIDTNGLATGTFSGNLTGDVTGNVSGNAGTVTNGIYTTSDATALAANTANKDKYLHTNASTGALEWSSVAGGGLTVGTTAIASGTTTKVLYDNAGTLGEYTVSGSGNVAMTTSPQFTTPSLGAATATSINNLKIGIGNTTNTTMYNVAIGDSVMGLSQSGGGWNTGVGKFALYINTSGEQNTAIGANSLLTNSTGNYNTAIGAMSLLDTVGSNNIGLGYFAGRYETGSNSFYVDSRNRTNTAGDKAGAILYGVMSDTPSSQTLTTNSAFTATYGMNIPTGQTYKINNVALTYSDVGALASNGTAAKATILETTRAIYGNNFDGSAALTQVIASTYGGTGNGFTKFTGPTTSEKTFTLPDENMTIVGLSQTQTLTNKIIQLNPAPADTTYSGETCSFTAGENLTAGQVCYLKSDGKMWKARANSVSTSGPFLICMAMGNIASASSGVFLMKGFYQNATLFNLTPCVPEYISDATAGAITETAPSSLGYIVRVIGYAQTADIIYFCPNNTYIEI